MIIFDTLLSSEWLQANSDLINTQFVSHCFQFKYSKGALLHILKYHIISYVNLSSF